SRRACVTTPLPRNCPTRHATRPRPVRAHRRATPPRRATTTAPRADRNGGSAVGFDFGFSEMLVVAVVALIVVGLERLPKAARFAGLWVRRARAVVLGGGG